MTALAGRLVERLKLHAAAVLARTSGVPKHSLAAVLIEAQERIEDLEESLRASEAERERARP